MASISWQTSEAIESWQRILRNTAGDKRANFQRASVELLRLADKEEQPDTRRVIVDALYEMAHSAGIDDGTAQAVMASGAQAPPDARPVNGAVYHDGEQPPPDGADAAPSEKAPARIVPPLTIAEWLSRDLPEPDFIMGDWLSTTSRALLVAPTGLGKTNLALGLGLHVAAGADFLHWRGRRPCNVLYIDGEMSRRLLRQHIADAAARLGSNPPEFRALSAEDVEGFAPLNTRSGQAYIDRLIAEIGKPDLVLFDSIMCLVVGDMKEGEPWAQIMPWVRSLTRRCIGQLWVHHTGHDESRSYGDKTKEWQLDTVMHMEPVARDDSDVSFSLEFRKARERTPATRADFQTARIALVGDQWTVEATALVRPGHVSPLGLKFLSALQNALATDTAEHRHGKRAATLERWRAECVAIGLLEAGNPTPPNARSLFSKHKRELIAANRIACDDRFAWTVT